MFPDGTFEMVCGTSILHHLDLNACINEIKRVLTPGGQAIFIEPLGHNPLVNLFRWLTPSMRSKDEHPLKQTDLDFLMKQFSEFHDTYYYLVSFLLLPIAGVPILKYAMRIVEAAERGLMNKLPFLRKYAWQVLLVLQK